MTPVHLLHVLIRVVHILGQLLHSAIHSLEQLVSSLVPPLDDLLGIFVPLLDYLSGSPVYFFDDLPEIPSGPSPIPNRENSNDKPEDCCSPEDIGPYHQIHLQTDYSKPAKIATSGWKGRPFCIRIFFRGSRIEDG